MNEPTQARPSWTKQQYDNIGQYENWLTLLDMANAIRFGFSQCRMPRPGDSIDMVAACSHINQLQEEWAKEERQRDCEHSFASSPDFQSLPDQAKASLHILLIEGKQKADEKYPVMPLLELPYYLYGMAVYDLPNEHGGA